MKKTILALALLGSTIGIAHADNFVGGSYGGSWSGIDRSDSAKANLNNPTFDDVFNHANTWGVRAGQTFGTYRAYATYDYSSGNSNSYKMNQQNLTGSLDYVYPINNNGTSVFAGGSMGVNRLVNRTAGYSNDDSYGFTYGAQAGVLQKLDKNFELEGGYKYMRNNNSIDYRQDGVKEGTAQLKYTQQVYAALNYHF